MGPGPGLVAHVLWRYCMRLASSRTRRTPPTPDDASRMQYRHKTCATSPGPGPIVKIHLHFCMIADCCANDKTDRELELINRSSSPFLALLLLYTYINIIDSYRL